jgi:hypothetical protein
LLEGRPEFEFHREVCPIELTSDEEMERGLGECIV